MGAHQSSSKKVVPEEKHASKLPINSAEDEAAMSSLNRLGFDLNGCGASDVNKLVQHRKVKGLIWGPIHAAASNGDIHIAQWLSSRGADLSSKNSYNQSPLMLACERGHLVLAEYLYETCGPEDFLVAAHGGSTTLMMARSEATSWLLAKGGADNEVLDRRDNHGDTALLHAVLAGDLISCRYLLRAALPVVGGSAIATAEAVAVVRKRNVNNDGCTLLHCAAMAGHANLLRWLFDTCLCHDLVQTLDQAGDSPLRLAAHWGHLDCAQLLVTFGAVEGLHGRADRALFERDVTELPVRSALLKWGGDAANELRGFQRNFLAGCLKKASPHLTMLRKPAKQHRDRPRIIIAEYAGIPFGSSARRARELGGLFGVSH